jgi:hypothetical protein
LIANIVFAAVQDFVRSRFLPHFRDTLLQHTSMMPVEAIAAKGREIQHGLVGQIGQVLGRAVDKASLTLKGRR